MKRIVGTAVLLALTLLPLAWAQPIDLLSPEITEAARKKPKPRGFPVLPGVYRLHGSEPSLPKNDLEPLRKIIGKATIVSLGESVHTSGGYYEMKHRLFRFLVEEMGFRAFAFETPWPDADRVGRYVETCQGTADGALRGIFGVWQSTETVELVQWMCAWNRSHPKPQDKLVFFGFDVQQPAQDGAALFAFLQRIGVAFNDPRIIDISACDGVTRQSNYPAPIPEANNQQCLRGLSAVDQLFTGEAERIIAETSATDFEYAKLRLVGIQSWQGQVFYARQDPRSTVSRDSGMAYAFGALRRLRYGKIKTAVWAHNFHIGKDMASSGFHVKTMGSFLQEMFGSSYVSIALISHVTAIDWLGVGCGDLAYLRNDDMVEKKLHDLGHAALLVDFDFPGGKPPFLAQGQEYGMSETGMTPAAQFDAAVFLDYSRKMDPTRWASCQ
ncbi:MAG: erythromycin esterase [Acidobacteriota bacterium]|jgi:erythromycin esterase-like protein|nr:erythromycin esterase [Acidobacteriota bacterium]